MSDLTEPDDAIPAPECTPADAEPPCHRIPVLIRTREYRALLMLAALVGVAVSLASWGFLELVHGLQTWLFDDLPDALGFETVPWWWPLPTAPAPASRSPSPWSACPCAGATNRPTGCAPVRRHSRSIFQRPARRTGHARAGARARPGGAADRCRDGRRAARRRPHRAAGARPGPNGCRCRRGVRCTGDDLRLFGDRCGPDHRGRRPGWAHPAPGPASRPAAGRAGLADACGHGVADRAELRRLGAASARAAHLSRHRS